MSIKKLKNIKKIIISSHTSNFELRENMNKKEFKINNKSTVELILIFQFILYSFYFFNFDFG